MTRQEMLDAINMNMAQVKHSDYGTSYFLPVMIGDVLDWIEHKFEGFGARMSGKNYTKKQFIKLVISSIWKTKRESLDKQDDELIKYIFDLLK